MMKKQPSDEPTQKTRPRGKDAEGKPAKPVTIPVPTRGEVERDLDKLASKPDKQARTAKDPSARAATVLAAAGARRGA